MKKTFLFAATVAMFAMASCSRDNDGVATPKGELLPLTIKIEGTAPLSKAIEQPGQADAVTLNDGIIFIVDPVGNVLLTEELNVAEATATDGQTLSDQVSVDSRAFVVGNVPTADVTALEASGNLSDVKAYLADISSQTLYTEAALSNTSGDAEMIEEVAGEDRATVHVNLNPVIARMELENVIGDETIKSFTVTGVYADDSFEKFNFVGGGDNLVSQGTSTDMKIVGDEGSWVAAADGSYMYANPQTADNGDVWAHNLAAGSLPRFIVKMTNVSYVKDGETVSGGDTEYFLTVSGYSEGLTSFERANIYRVGGSSVAGEKGGLIFGYEDLDLKPNPDDVDVDITVEVDPWTVVVVTPLL